MRGKLTALSDSRWKYESGRRVYYIKCWPEGRWTADGERLDGVSSVEEAMDRVDGVLPAPAPTAHCPVCRLHVIVVRNAFSGANVCGACGTRLP